MSRSRGRLGRAKEKIFVRPSLDATRPSQNRLRSDWERVWSSGETTGARVQIPALMQYAG